MDFKDSLGNRGIHIELVPDFNGCPSHDYVVQAKLALGKLRNVYKPDV